MFIRLYVYMFIRLRILNPQINFYTKLSKILFIFILEIIFKELISLEHG